MPKKEYDVIIIGGGLGGYSQAALQANAGRKVLLLEAGKKVGGYSRTIKRKGYSFTVGIHYLMGCEKGGVVNKFLKKLGLDGKIKFNSLSKECYDKISFPDQSVCIPISLRKYERKLIKLYPTEKESLKRFFEIVREAAPLIEEDLSFKKIALSPLKHKILLKYGLKTVDEVFDELKLSRQLRGILAAQCGDYGLPPKDASFFALVSVLSGYCKSASFPKRGMEFFTNEIVNLVKSKGGEIKCNSKVVKIHQKSGKIESAETENGKKYQAKEFISNIDPNKTLRLVKGKLPLIAKVKKSKIKYPYSVSCISIFLGLKGVDMRKHGFGKWNIWHYADHDINKVVEGVYKKHSYKKPFLFISTPSLYTSPNTLAPKEGVAMQIIAPGKYDFFSKQKKKGTYKKEVKRIEKEILDYMDENFVPNIRKYIDLKITWTPIDLEEKMGTPKGNIYGKQIDPKTIVFKKVGHKSPFENLHFVGATASASGMRGVLTGSMDLFKNLKI